MNPEENQLTNNTQEVTLDVIVKCDNPECELFGQEVTIFTKASVARNGVSINKFEIEQPIVGIDCEKCSGKYLAVGQAFLFRNGNLEFIKRLEEEQRKWLVEFTHILQDAVDYDGPEEFMVSEVFFKITRGDDFFGKHTRSLQCTIREPFYDSNESHAPELNIIVPIEIQSEVDNTLFIEEAKKYYSSIIGSSIKRVRGNYNRIRNNHLASSRPYKVFVPANLGQNSGTW
jgi:hypothetical protein